MIRSEISKFKEGEDNSNENKNENPGSTIEQLLLKDLKNVANEYIEIENIKKRFSNIVLQNLNTLKFQQFIDNGKFYIKENLIKKSVNSSDISGLNVVSVDGSSVIKKFMNVDFIFLKAIGVKYHFYQNQSAKIEYFPDLHGFNNYDLQGNFLNREGQVIDTKSSLDMTLMEIQLLNQMIEKYDDIDVIILDGSIVIMPIHLLFSKDYEVSQKYDRLLKEYKKLYSNCQEERIILTGCIKDTNSRSLTNLFRDAIQLLKPSYSNLKDFIDINYRQVMEYFGDVDLFSRILKKSERSCIFNCKREIDKIRDTGIKKEISYYFPLSFYAFYLKAAKYDVPCRIEFFMDEKHDIKEARKKANLISSILMPISNLNENYGLPIPQIEAHRRAVFKPHEVNLLFKNLTRTLNSYGIKLQEKRRNRRPF
ncbi:MAG: NurA domain protein [Promethearchaeota archaeon]|nr:MAG: NurA domain protein [Candidatus Lokiarchaeota archaeon]